MNDRFPLKTYMSKFEHVVFIKFTEFFLNIHSYYCTFIGCERNEKWAWLNGVWQLKEPAWMPKPIRNLADSPVVGSAIHLFRDKQKLALTFSLKSKNNTCELQTQTHIIISIFSCNVDYLFYLLYIKQQLFGTWILCCVIVYL